MINTKRLLDTFYDYVKIDSETGDEKEFAEHLVTELEALGLEVSGDDSGKGANSTTNNVFAYLAGDEALEPILFTAHMDTVIPGRGIEPYEEDGVIRSKGNTVLGADDKSGIAALVEAVRVIKEQNLHCRPVEFLFTVREESSLGGSRHADLSRIRSRNSIAMDGCGPMDEIVTRGSGQISMQAEIIGQASHAGGYPEKGISAIMVAAEAISNMKLLRVDEETTANIGSVNTNNPTNIVCDRLTLAAETRSRNAGKLEAQAAHMRDCLQKACDKYGAALHYEQTELYSSFDIPDEHPFVCFLKEKYRNLGVEAKTASTAVGSDSNILNTKGFTAVVIPTGMTTPHTKQESVKVEDLEFTAKLALEIMTIF